MSNWGRNEFVIEGANGKYLYEKIMNAVDMCTEFNKRYFIEEIKNHTYTIEKSITEHNDTEYFITAWKGDKIIVWSWFFLPCIEFDDNKLIITEKFCRGCGAIEQYIRDMRFYESGFYYYSCNEFEPLGATNDKDGKYFERCCVIEGFTSEEDKDFQDNCSKMNDTEKEIKYHEIQNKLEKQFLPEDFYEWSFEKQISYCESHSENIHYQYVALREFMTFE